MNTDSKKSLYDLDHTALLALLQGWNEPAFRAKQIWEWLYVRLASSYDAMSNLPGTLRERLSATYPIGSLSRSSAPINEE